MFFCNKNPAITQVNTPSFSSLTSTMIRLIGHLNLLKVGSSLKHVTNKTTQFFRLNFFSTRLPTKDETVKTTFQLSKCDDSNVSL